MRWYYWAGLGLAVIALAVGLFINNRISAALVSQADIDSMRRAYQQEDQSAFRIPAPQSLPAQAPNRLHNAYFGELHVHTNLSFDSYIFGNRLTPDESYKFAKGQQLLSPIGEPMQLAVPLDFAAVTDHAEGYGLLKECNSAKLGKPMRALCQQIEQPNINLFMKLRDAGTQRPPAQLITRSPAEEAQAVQFAEQTWAEIVAVANAHNEPGRFTAFAGFEYSPPLPNRGKIHRNVIFRSDHVPNKAVSAYDALTEIDLWKQLKAGCQEPCAFLTILHNPNKTWGLAFANHTIDGDIYAADDWRLRDAYEPLVEMYQIKGNSECALGVGTTDEECGFEQFLPPCAEGQITGCVAASSMARDGLKIGLTLEAELGFNPLDFGMIGASDNHNSAPGDVEEWDFRGASGMVSATAEQRLAPGFGNGYRNLLNNPGGLAAIWAPENTRAALFEAMQRKEVYATSGTRIRLRFFASFDYASNLADTPSLLETAYQDGVPMGGALSSRAGQPRFLVWATQDPLSAPLDRLQIIKGWVENGEVREAVQDVICADGRAINPQTKRCAPTTASVDLSSCAHDARRGAAELKTVWTDTDYHRDQKAFYYARVIQNPTCRWSTYDSLRLNQPPPSRVPATIREMAWSSPIWLGPQN
jgi:hypothetical protein